jgi:hypothetical protein
VHAANLNSHSNISKGIDPASLRGGHYFIHVFYYVKRFFIRNKMRNMNIKREQGYNTNFFFVGISGGVSCVSVAFL